MFLNLSNHPSLSWSQNQRTAAEHYGSISDMPFPSIDPHGTPDQILIMAEKYGNEIRKMNPRAVHIMGELTFTFCLVHLLQSWGYLCLASTSERMVEEKEGKKVITFSFVQFRTYPVLV